MPRHHLLPALLVLAGAAGCNSGQAPLAPPKPADVVVSRAFYREVTDFEEFQGKTDASQAIDVRARVTGKLTRFNFQEGEEVRQGQVIFEIDPAPFEAEFERTRGNEEELKARVGRMQRDLDRARTGPSGLSPEEIDKRVGDLAEAKGLLAAAAASRKIAQINLGFCYVTAPGSGRISRRFVDGGNIVKGDDTILTRILRLDPIYVYFDIDERTYLRIQRLLTRDGISPRQRKMTQVAAHVLSQTLVAQGQAPGGVPVGALARHLSAAAVAGSDAYGTKMPLTMALADEAGGPRSEGGFPHQGVVDFVDNRVDPDTGSLWLRGVFPNPTELLTPGLFARLRLPIGEPHRAVLIPEKALATDQGQKHVWVVDDNNHATYKLVKLGAQHGALRVVEDGVEPGQRVIVSGLQRVRNDPQKGYAEVNVLREDPPEADNTK
jgi:multidrug efflux pump subunit AcrA (membrane-fusion protein)